MLSWDILLSRVSALQSSSHGPFDCLLCAGKCFSSFEDFRSACATLSFPIPTFVLCGNINIPSEFELPKNLEILKQNELFTLLDLTVLVYSHDSVNGRVLENIKAAVNSKAYRGCDFLISDAWPYDLHQFLSDRLL